MGQELDNSREIVITGEKLIKSVQISVIGLENGRIWSRMGQNGSQIGRNWKSRSKLFENCRKLIRNSQKW
jgi:hypothetical protein